MHRRAYLSASAAVAASLAGCDAAPPDWGTPTPTEDPRRTVRNGPGGPGCPGKSWGQTAAIPETYDRSVDDAADAETLLEAAESGEYRVRRPRPDGVHWKRRTIYVAYAYDADDWYLFLTEKSVDLVGVLVVSLAGDGTEVVWFYVGDC